MEGSGSRRTVTFEVEMLDKNRNPQKKRDIYQMSTQIDGDAVAFDMSGFMNTLAKNANNIDFESSDDKLWISSSLASGDKLKDTKITSTAKAGDGNTDLRVKYDIAFSGECLAIEEVTVPAGAFKCHKIAMTGVYTANAETSMGNMRVLSLKVKCITWNAPGIGAVKSETYDDKGRLQSVSELQSAGKN